MIRDKLITMLEAIKKVMSVRDGVPVQILTSTKPNYKIVDGQEVRMSLQEIINRSKASKKAALKKTAQQDTINDKRKESMEKREEQQTSNAGL